MCCASRGARSPRSPPLRPSCAARSSCRRRSEPPADDYFARPGLPDQHDRKEAQMSQETRMQKTTSRDGTAIAYERRGEGPPVIFVVGAFNDRSTGAPLAAALAPRFTVLTYDRRGRGDSGDAAAYAVDR